MDNVQGVHRSEGDMGARESKRGGEPGGSARRDGRQTAEGYTAEGPLGEDWDHIP